MHLPIRRKGVYESRVHNSDHEEQILMISKKFNKALYYNFQPFVNLFVRRSCNGDVVFTWIEFQLTKLKAHDMMLYRALTANS